MVRFPTLRAARLPADSYPGQTEPVDTLVAQLLLAGPVVESVAATGPQGPAASEPATLTELSDESVRAISDALGGQRGGSIRRWRSPTCCARRCPTVPRRSTPPRTSRC